MTSTAAYSASSCPKTKVTTKPRTLTVAIMPRTAGTPNLPFKIGRTKTPRVAPILATPAAKPLAVARSCVGNKLGASVNRSGVHQQVEQDEASEHERNVSRGCGRTRYASSDRQQQHAESHARETDRLHANAPEPRDRPDSKKKTEEQEHIDRSASPGICEVTGDDADSLTGEINCTQDNRGEKSDAIGSDIHQKPGNRDQRRTSSIAAREKDRYSGCFRRRN